MNRKLILLNLGLVALAGWLFWMLRLKWVELHMHESTVLALSPQVRKRLVPPPPLPPFKPMAASDYNEVAQKTLFAKDRNPNVIIEVKPVAAPPPPPPMPALPFYYGTMSIGDPPVIMLKLPKDTQKRYHAGEKVGPFELVSFDSEKIVFEWDGKMVERKPEDLKEKESATPEAAAAAPKPAAAAAAAPVAKTISSDEMKDADRLGLDEGNVRLCVPGDTSPSGTVVGEYKKKVLNGPFGQTCTWEKQ
ncbi:MAG: hypothetical protein ABSF12_00370 [Bryobacteraceae bacterium]